VTVTEVERTAAEPPVVEPGHLDEATRDVLRRAKELLLNRGWCRGPMGMPFAPDHNGSLCVAGAIYAAGVSYGVYSYTAEVFGFARPNDVWKWNDAKGRTLGEVVALFDRALTTSDREAVAP
jgi:hypothetical protein